MSIKYEGNEQIKEKVNKLIEEMLGDEEFQYQITIYEGRKNGKISECNIDVTDVKSTMPNF